MADPDSADRSASQPVPLVSLADRDRQVAPMPVPLTSFIGREREIAAVVDLLRNPVVRLVTLTGPGGVGKTRLALRVAEHAGGDFADGVVFVSLAPVTDPDLVAAIVARAVGVHETGGRAIGELLTEALRASTLLLVLDNFEQVLAAATLVVDVLAACPGLRVLVTSRARLQVSGEHAYPVPPLSLADPAVPPQRLAEGEAVRLFADRARAVDPGFALGSGNAQTMAAICARLDGLPLAIELAAAKIRVLPPSALLARLERRLPLLGGGGRDQPWRLRTMRDAIAWSYDLLTVEEQKFFRGLSVFVGGFTLAAAEYVGGGVADRPEEHESTAAPSPLPAAQETVLDGITSLVESSLLHQVEGPGGEPRFTMLETVREYGLERLAASGEDQATRAAHAASCLDFAERFSRFGSTDPGWLNLAEADHDNFRAALAWLVRAGDSERELQLAGAMAPLWFEHSHHREGIDRLERALALPGAASRNVLLRATASLCILLERQGQYERALSWHADWASLAHELGDPIETARAMHWLGVVAVNQGRYAEGTGLIEEARAVFAAEGFNVGLNWANYLLGIAAYGQGAFAEAATRVEAALASRRSIGDTLGVATALDALALLRCELGDTASGATMLAEALPLWRDYGNRQALAEWLAATARLAAARADHGRAARLYGAAETLGEAVESPLLVPPPGQYRRVVDALRAEMGTADFAAAWAAGRALPVDEAIACGLGVTVDSLPADGPAVEGGKSAGGGLTPREREVLQLVAEGRTDREVAAALYISERTVEWHLANAFEKLGVGTRAAAATAALRRGLI